MNMQLMGNDRANYTLIYLVVIVGSPNLGLAFTKKINPSPGSRFNELFLPSDTTSFESNAV